MKSRNFTFLNRRHFILLRNYSIFLLFLFSASFSGSLKAQCPGGYTQAFINWDNLDYFPPTNANYTSFLTTWPWYRNQNFAFGKQRMEFIHNYATVANVPGENTLHTGETGSYGTGADVQFKNNATITLKFDAEIRNLKFSIYDIDRSQSFAITAVNAANVQQTITTTRLGTTVLSLPNGNGVTNMVITANAGSFVPLTSVDATCNIDIAGPVKAVTLTITGTTTNSASTNDASNEDGSFWISDIAGCTTGNFATNYYAVSKPLPGQPAYVISSPDNDSVYAINTTTGATQYLFDMPGAIPPFVNGLGYDPVKKILYYIQENNWPGTAGGPFRALWKYDFNTETSTQINADIRTRGVPLFNRNVESGSSAFYDGKLYFGIEATGTGGSVNTGRESSVWRFDPEIAGDSGVQVFAVPADNGSRIIHDWGDIAINNGILYNFNSVTTDSSYIHYDIWNQNIVNTYIPTSYLHAPRQCATQWDGTIISVGDSVTTYNNGFLTLPQIKITGNNWRRDATFNNNLVNSAAGDAAGAFRPRMDFGDAPASYYTGADTAAHERDLNLRLGSTFDREWNAPVSANADADDLAAGGDEDGLGAAPAILNYSGTLTYNVNNISVFNNTGVNATLIVWLDYNFNGIFEAGEGRSVTVPTNAATQTFNLTWSSIYVPNTAATKTFLRIRLTRASNSMTFADMNRYMPDGEVEDYLVARGVSLPDNNIRFTATKKSNQQIDINWSIRDMAGITGYEIERSADGSNWYSIASKVAGSNNSYSDEDNAPITGQSYYRIKIMYANGSSVYTPVQAIAITNTLKHVKLYPNPAVSSTRIDLNSEMNGKANVEIYNIRGILVNSLQTNVTTGDNSILLNNLEKLSSGVYTVYVAVGNQIIAIKLLIAK
jgi:GEVED domain/Secretion system C-terminal sorting domain